MGYLKMEYYLGTKDDDESKYLLIGRLWCKFFEIKKNPRNNLGRNNPIFQHKYMYRHRKSSTMA